MLPRILIADDEPYGQQLLQAILLEENYDLVFAENGQKAINSIHEFLPDLVLLDVMMPEMNGFEVCQKIISDDQTKGIPIILITALDDRDSRKRGLEAGANDYISKPFDRNEVLAKVKNMLRLSPSHTLISKTQPSVQKQLSLDIRVQLINRILDLHEPSKDYIQHQFQDFFRISVGIKETGNCFLLFQHNENKIYTLLMTTENLSVDDKLLNILIISYINRIIHSHQVQDPAGFVNQLNLYLLEIEGISGSLTLKNFIHGLTVLNIDKKNNHINLAGINQYVVILDNDSIKKINLYKTDNFPDQKHHFNEISYTISESICLYLSNVDTSDIFNYHKDKEVSDESLSESFNTLFSLTMEEQKVLFERTIEDTMQKMKGHENIYLVGMKIKHRKV